MSVYVVDTNFFIQAHRAYYPLDIAHSFWGKVRELASNGTIMSIEKVKNEIFVNDDELKEWCKTNLPADFFKNSSLAIEEYAKVVTWANGRESHYTQSARTEFLNTDEADAFLVAYTLADVGNKKVVTQEVSSPQSKKKVKIPDACIALEVQYLNTMEMLRELGETF